jgi:hypothetical protein
MVRAELKKIDVGLPRGGDALTTAHFADLHLRIKEALNPTRPVVNFPQSLMRSINTDEIIRENNGGGYMNCWPRTVVDK